MKKSYNQTRKSSKTGKPATHLNDFFILSDNYGISYITKAVTLQQIQERTVSSASETD